MDVILRQTINPISLPSLSAIVVLNDTVLWTGNFGRRNGTDPNSGPPNEYTIYRWEPLPTDNENVLIKSLSSYCSCRRILLFGFPVVVVVFFLNDETVRVIKMFTSLCRSCSRDEREDVALCPPGGGFSIKAGKLTEGKINR